jgi:hypothetical protein
MKAWLTAVVALAWSVPASAQWLNHSTPGIPRNADGSANLAAPTPRDAQGRPDLSGLWNGQAPVMLPPPNSMQPAARELHRQRQETFFKDSPRYRCQPSGFETAGGWTRIVQTPAFIAILNDDLTYRQIFLDGRALEPDPFRTWMGYSVGRWDGDTLIVDSFGYNDKTWLGIRGLPHTEALRVTERYRRLDFGHLTVETTIADPAAYSQPWTFTLDLELAADTEMVEAVCETGTDRWTGSLSDTRRAAIEVPPDVLARYVGVYRGRYVQNLRTVEITLVDGELFATINGDSALLIPTAPALFESAQGLAYEFVAEGTDPAAAIVEIHVSGNYRYARQR